jgi:predicted dehydrogenase
MAKPQPIRLGILGLGRAGWGMHCPELAGKEAMFQIVAACDLLPDRRQRMADRYGCVTYADAESLVADPAVEMVAVATRSCDHYAHALLALRAGKHVFLEKPMCATHAEAKRLVAAASRAKGRLYVRHNRRCEPAFLHVREIIASGILGEVFQVKLARVGYSRRDDWQTLRRFGGGQLLNWGPHIVDHALRLLGSPVKNVWSDLRRVAAVGDAEDHLKVVLTGANGRVVDMEISGGAAVPLPEYVLWGTRGGLIGQGDTLSLRYLDPAAKLPRRRPSPATPDASFGSQEKLPWIEQTLPVAPKKAWNIWDELYRAVRRGTRFPISLDEALEVMRIISLAKRGTPFAE